MFKCILFAYIVFFTLHDNDKHVETCYKDYKEVNQIKWNIKGSIYDALTKQYVKFAKSCSYKEFENK